MTFNYNDAIRFFEDLANNENLPDFGNTTGHFSLESIDEILHLLGRPERKISTIHIAGTKGKGSTAAMIASILSHSGKKTGLYTSPHLNIIRERIVIDGEMISRNDFAEMTSYIRFAVKSSGNKTLTHFEALTALTFLYFARKEVHIAVIEAGLGGKHDATNVIVPLVSVITSISLDHTSVLGNTAAEIALEKAGIIKKNGILVSAPQNSEITDVLTSKCAELDAQYFPVCLNKLPGGQFMNSHGTSFSASYLGENQKFRIPLPGEHQIENASVAVKVIEVLQNQGITVSSTSLSKGLFNVRWPGRFQLLADDPHLVVDGAHNPYSAGCLRKTLLHVFDNAEIIFVIGIAGDKDIRGIIQELNPVAKAYVVTSSGHPRAMAADKLSEIVRQHEKECYLSSDVVDAVKQVFELVRKNEVICVTGSLHVVGETLKVFGKGEENVSGAG
ncbi:MAG: bifunctional folylpolyglutamate synthase/dihydrofolate synthase [Candidatus Riflebacteria bacterium]|nr:bifunctional folylpolyglutamate synthase/dihydrofolate synthase [Candidatus Riflebacteria bacterium]